MADSLTARHSSRFRAAVAMLLLAVGLISAASAVALGRPKQPGRLIPDSPEVTTLSDGSAEFLLTNDGELPVHILNVTTSCGCAKPQVNPSVVPAGGTARLAIRAMPPKSGERRVDVVVTTDSSQDPVLKLLVKVAGSRQTPCLASAAASLVYHGDFRGDSTRFITVLMSEWKSETREPLISTDLSFLKITKASTSESVSEKDPLQVVRSYSYQVEIEDKPPDEQFQGEVRVVSPYDPEDFTTFPVRNEPIPPIQAAPSRGTLTIKPGQSTDATLKLLIRAKNSNAKLIVEAEPGGSQEGPLAIGPLTRMEAEGIWKLTIGLKPGQDTASGEFRIVIRDEASQGAPCIVPILVRREVQP